MDVHAQQVQQVNRKILAGRKHMRVRARLTTGLPTAALSHAPGAPRLNTRPSVLVATCVLLLLLAACSSEASARARQLQWEACEPGSALGAPASC